MQSLISQGQIHSGICVSCQEQGLLWNEVADFSGILPAYINKIYKTMVLSCNVDVAPDFVISLVLKKKHLQSFYTVENVSDFLVLYFQI